MLKIGDFLDICEIIYNEESLLKLEELVNISMERHIHKWLEKLKLKIQQELSFECSICYNSNEVHQDSDFFTELKKLLAFDYQLENEAAIDGEYKKSQLLIRSFKNQLRTQRLDLFTITFS